MAGVVMKCKCSDLMKKNRVIWRRLGIGSGNDIYPYLGAPRQNWNRYAKEAEKMLKKCGFSKRNKVPERIRNCLEGKNIHSLNQVIDFTSVGVGQYGLRTKAFFTRLR